ATRAWPSAATPRPRRGRSSIWAATRTACMIACAAVGRQGRGHHLPRRVPGAGDHARGAGGGPDGGESPRSGHRRGVCGRRYRPMRRPIAELWGTGSYTPKRVLTNDEFSKMLDTSDQWIRERTGIRERRVAGADESNACMAKAAAEQVLADT